MHGAKNYPWHKVATSQDLGLPDGTGDATYLALLDEALPRVVQSKPDLVLYLAGVDPLQFDALGRLKLTHAGLMERDRRVLSTFRSLGVPVAMVLGGGYARPIEHSVEAHVNTYRVARALAR
jgi:acetoin utilization deacetylase AcuC-like enzyme